MSAKSNKFEREGYRVDRIDENKAIDCTEDYTKAFIIINDRNGEMERRGSNDEIGQLFKIQTRHIGPQLIRIGTPVEKIHPTHVQSPSNNKADQMLLPGVSLASQEQQMRKDQEQMSRGAKNANEKAAQKEQAANPSSKTQQMISRMTQPKIEKIDYLTPMRKLRDYKESLKGDYSVDFKKIQQKAKTKQATTTKQPAFITHLRDDPYLSLMKDQELKPPEEMKKTQQKKQSKAKGKEAIMKELEAIKR